MENSRKGGLRTRTRNRMRKLDMRCYEVNGNVEPENPWNRVEQARSRMRPYLNLGREYFRRVANPSKFNLTLAGCGAARLAATTGSR